LQKVDGLAKSASTTGAPTNVLIFLSFSRLNNALWDQPRSEQVRRAFWAELKRFGLGNIDHHGKLKSNSPLHAITHAALLLELRKIDLPELFQSFCKACLIQVPPFSDGEITELWRKRTGATLPEEVLKELKDEAGGHPFLIDLITDLVVADRTWSPSANEDAQLACVQGVLKRLVEALGRASGDEQRSRADDPPDLINRWRSYVRWLRDNLPQTTLNNMGPLLQLQDPDSDIEPTVEHSDWLASGLVWVNPGKVGPLSGFAQYPNISSPRFPKLIKDIIQHLGST
jgi:hypothetical protein